MNPDARQRVPTKVQGFNARVCSGNLLILVVFLTLPSRLASLSHPPGFLYEETRDPRTIETNSRFRGSLMKLYLVAVPSRRAFEDEHDDEDEFA